MFLPLMFSLPLLYSILPLFFSTLVLNLLLTCISRINDIKDRHVTSATTKIISSFVLFRTPFCSVYLLHFSGVDSTLMSSIFSIFVLNVLIDATILPRIFEPHFCHLGLDMGNISCSQLACCDARDGCRQLWEEHFLEISALLTVDDNTIPR